MFRLGLDRLATGATIGGILCRFLINKEVLIPEAFIYVSLAIIIAGYWSFQAWLHIAEKERLKTPEIETDLETLREHVKEVDHGLGEVSKQIEAHNSRINALLLRIGLQ